MNKKGFTLIELLVVIAIIGLLSTLAVVSLNNARAKSRDAKRVADIKQVQTALELHYNDNNEYPFPGSAGTNGDIMPLATDGTTQFSTYMAATPEAPLPFDGPCTATTNDYIYSCYQNTTGTACANAAATGVTYDITFCLGAKTGDLASGARTASPAGIQ